ncbi:MAG: hypothetical protein Q7S88_02315 [Candidatus Daviesbacteria bacterium]|nr:hypothetical protein [Candidatus Daviesbacteria bacterium]
MNYITTTELRTKSSQLVETLKKGGSVSLIHRSKVIGEFKPKQDAKPMTKSGIKELKRLAKELNLPKMTYAQREKTYRKHLVEKYGKGLS